MGGLGGACKADRKRRRRVKISVKVQKAPFLGGATKLVVATAD